MSIFTYNGVALPFPLHSKFEQKAIYDPSNTDFISTGIDIQLSSIVNADYANFLLAGQPAAKATDPASVIAAVRSKLLQPRKALSVTFNGKELIPLKQDKNSGTVDAMNGPQPQFCNIVRCTNTTFLINYGIKATYFENPSFNAAGGQVNAAGGDVLYNRWEETADIDSCNYTTRTRTGEYMIRSDNVSALSVDRIRSQMAMLGTPTGFLRKSSKYGVSKDGLHLQYTLVDVEKFKQPPFPAFEARGTYKEQITKMLSIRRATVEVELKGSKTTSQSDLLKTALSVAIAKLSRSGIVQILQNWNIEVDMYENRVSVVVRGQFKVSNNAKSVVKVTNAQQANQVVGRFAGVNWKKLVETPLSDSDPTYIPGYSIRGTAGILLQAAAYYDPSLLGTTVDPTKGQLTTGKEIGTAGRKGE